MSSNFRPVQEIWGDPSSMFLEHDDLIRFLEELGERSGGDVLTEEYGQYTSVFFPDGNAVFAYVEKDPNFTMESFIEDLPWDGDDERIGNLASVIHNLKAFAPDWRKNLDKSGALTFYVD